MATISRITSIALTSTVAFLCAAGVAESEMPTARFVHVSVRGDEASGRLDDCRLVRGDGWLTRHADAHTPGTEHGVNAGARINRLLWNRVGIEFTPLRSGTVRLVIFAPLEERLDGGAARQPDLAVADVSVDIGARETIRQNEADAGADWCLAPVERVIEVEGGVPVRLWFLARALPWQQAPPVGDAPLPHTPAHEAVLRFSRGVNLANYLEAPPGEDWSASFSEADLATIAAEGFDHVRIPVAWHHHAGEAPDYSIAPEFFARVDSLVTSALSRGLSVIVTLHHFHDFTSEPERWTDKFLALWTQIAERYRNTDAERLAFELLNEPHANATTAIMNTIYEAGIERVRRISPTRPILVGPGDYNAIAELDLLRLPAGDSNLIVTVHDYSPFLFTHQGAAWTHPLTATTGIEYPGPPAAPPPINEAIAGDANVAAWLDRYGAVEARFNPCGPDAWRDALAYLRAWSLYHGRPVRIGEWGCFRGIDPASRARFHRDKRNDFDAYGIPWTLWDWKAQFAYWDAERGEPLSGLREALEPALRPLARRRAAPSRTLSAP